MYQQKVSVVIPSYNRADRLQYCIESVLDQTCPVYEIIVVDDCSCDNTGDVISRFPESRVRYVLLDRNSGAQAARNRGISEATGNWIAFQDSDDEWLHNKIEIQLKALSQYNFDEMSVVHGDCWRLDPETNQKELWSLSELHGDSKTASLLAAPGPLFPAILTSKRALEKIALLDENVLSWQEWDTSIRLAKECRFIHLQEPLFVYHLHAGETLSKNQSRDIRGYQYIVEKFTQDIIDHCGLAVLHEHFRKNACRAMRMGLFEEAMDILTRTSERTIEVWFLKTLARTRRNPEPYMEVINSLRSISRRGKG